MIIIPTYNEKDNIEELVRRIRGAHPTIFIWFVDDSSPDGTAQVIRSLQRRDGRIGLLLRPQKLGLGQAYRHAIRMILHDHKPEYIITMDADLSHPPEMIPLIVKRLSRHPVVVGSRYVAGGRVVNWHPFRKFISRAGSVYAKILTGVPVADMTAGFVGYQTEFLRRLDFSRLNSDGYRFQIEMKHKLHSLGADFDELPITFTERNSGKSKFNASIMLEAALYPPKIFLKRLFRRQ